MHQVFITRPITIYTYYQSVLTPIVVRRMLSRPWKVKRFVMTFMRVRFRAALKGLRNHKVTSKLLWECWKELSDLTRHNSVELLWVPGHSGIKGNEKVDELARKGSSASYIGPEPAVGVSKTMVRSQVKEWVNAQHKEYWKNITRHQNGKIFKKEPAKKLILELLALSRNKLRVITDLLTGH
ncbi:hypothetical protein NQ315_008356 [Exocentrus adspersus]|uniref:RNase H type-1 domain-containing protein n=1 Tax=Exocentrus adspersus TaxID=1586481 RepID=A0AAV8VSS4_9CUCU|nr:hypothetical protein NQ315_008356 [Exocentrus adspersus]